jgi:hypothetical protein
MFHGDFLEGIDGSLSHVGGALVDNVLGPLGSSQGISQHAGDEVGALVVVDDDRIEQVLVATADVLCCDELQGDAERRQSRGIGRNQGVGQQEVEAESGTPWSALSRCGRRRGRPQDRSLPFVLARWVTQPRTESPRAEREGLAEPLLRHARESVQSL